MERILLHKGVHDFGGGNNGLLIHHGQGIKYRSKGLLEEVFLHEASHTSLNSYHATSPGWIAAQKADGQFISEYARDNPLRQDVAESFPMCYAVRYKSSEVSNNIIQTIITWIN